MSKPKVKLIGEDGNIFNLLAIASRHLDKDTASKMTDRVYDEAQSYGDALNIIQEYVTIV